MLKVDCVWTVKERRSQLWIPTLRRKNTWTNYGLGQLASAIGGGYSAPNNLVVDSNYGYLSTGASLGANSIQVSARQDLVGDTHLVINPGGGSQETVTFSAVSGTGPYTYTLTGTLANTHLANEAVVRLPLAADTLSTVISEIQYDATNAPGLRVQASSGYSQGNGNWTLQFYITATEALTHLMTLGLSENQNVGQGNLHNHIVLGYDHSGGSNDLEIDVSLTLTN